MTDDEMHAALTRWRPYAIAVGDLLWTVALVWWVWGGGAR